MTIGGPRPEGGTSNHMTEHVEDRDGRQRQPQVAGRPERIPGLVRDRRPQMVAGGDTGLLWQLMLHFKTRARA